MAKQHVGRSGARALAVGVVLAGAALVVLTAAVSELGAAAALAFTVLVFAYSTYIQTRGDDEPSKRGDSTGVTR